MEIDGVINLNKPVGITSAKALYRVRKVTRVRKSGHAGALDPAADGVLVLCLGRATKLVESLMDQPKVYRASARLDVTSESYDSDRPLVQVPVTAAPSEAVLREACRAFEGEIKQIPPKISAVKVDGLPAYRRNRAGETLQLKPRPAVIHWLRLRRYEWPELEFELACGRGTYVRALIRDLGTALNTGGCLTSLTRTRVGPFVLSESVTFSVLEAGERWTGFLTPLSRVRELLAARPVAIPPAPTE